MSEENYRCIAEYAGELQKTLQEPVSLDKALSFIFNKGKLSDLAGSWKMTDKEAVEFMHDLRGGWKKWTIKSA